MRRGRKIALLCVLLGVAALAGSSSAFAGASPREICDDLADNGKLDSRQYTIDEVIAAAKDASIQGYCSLVTVVPPQPPPPPPPPPPPAQPAAVCTEATPNAPGATLAPDGKWYINYNPAMCGQAPPANECREAAPNAPGATLAPNGKWYTDYNPAMCGQVATPASPPAAPVAPPVTGGTLPAQVTKVTQVANPASAQPQAQAQPAGVAGQQSPLRVTPKKSGTLPFTGAELLVFAIIGGALIAAGLILRATGRQKQSS